jgi:hypothetical protein
VTQRQGDNDERTELYERFVGRFGCPRWGERDVSRPMSADSIALLERELSVCFPVSLSQFLGRHGDVSLAELSRTWLFSKDRACPVPMDEVFGPKTMPLANGTAWLAPIPATVSGAADIHSDNAFRHLIAFAGDTSGNWFCFRRIDCAKRSDDLPVFYFDHDGGAIEQISPTLDDLIRRYLMLPAAQGARRSV